ncbi:scarecrow-like protein 30 [Impatiens glandulifera]|uniref:scarecrow-like protein 30 n=1 Tax=Impatiens glandulifera TaxID=253017 RepID=UPI001FB09D5C|nr:scarecrow-like protein 30 [Impatiens glandulifera]
MKSSLSKRKVKEVHIHLIFYTIFGRTRSHLFKTSRSIIRSNLSLFSRKTGNIFMDAAQNRYYSMFNIVKPEDRLVMDQNFGEELTFDQNFIIAGNLDQNEDEFPLDQNIINGFDLHGNCLNSNFFNPAPSFLDPDPIVVAAAPQYSGIDRDSHEDYDFSDVILSYISQILMEEDVEEKTCMFQESAALQAAEKSLYEVIGEKYPSSTDLQPFPFSNDIIDSTENCYSCVTSSNSNTSSCSQLESIWNPNLGEYDLNSLDAAPMNLTSQSPYSSLSSPISVIDSCLNNLLPVSAETFLQGPPPNGNGLWMDSSLKPNVVVVKTEENDRRKKKNPYDDDDDDEEEGIRSNKQAAVCSETTVKPEMFDMVLLCSGGKNYTNLREELQNEMNKNGQLAKSSNSRKSRGKKSVGGGNSKRNMVDLTTLLTLCAQSVSSDDWKTANDLLKQIRQHSSQTGDGMQRMAYYFANGLEARMAGSGAQLHMKYPSSAAEILKAYHLFLAACPFKKMTNFVSNKSIMKIAKKATRLHIIDFGILYGFQWPCLIQRISSRPGGPPSLRITGIDLPNPGFRPTQRVDETGRRLSHYAQTFNVPFSFQAIAQKWETIKISDLNLDEDEVLVVNCHWRFRNLLDETVVMDSPRNVVLNLIKEMKPDMFIQAVVNGAYSAPFFSTRFREAVFHFSSLFDMLDTTVPRDVDERVLIERLLFGWESMNVIACEGAQRIERPETYKQWQVRIMRAGFRQVALDREIVTMTKERVKSCYHKDFLIDEDANWMLQGWKGRILFAISLWKPV